MAIDEGGKIGHDEAELCVMLLVDGTGKGAWDDGSVALYTSVFANYRNLELLSKACVEALQTEYFGKPSLPAVKEIYDKLYRIEQMEFTEREQRRELTPAKHAYPSFDRGIEIMTQAYKDHCEFAGKRPDEAQIAEWSGFGREDRRQAALYRRRRM